MSGNAGIARSTYRQLLRAIHVAFQNDVATLDRARMAAAEQFRQAASVPEPSSQGSKINPFGPPEQLDFQGRIEHALGVARILRENVVQGEQDTKDPARYRLNIRDETERGDNESIKSARKENARTPLRGTAKAFSR